jgi:hypothetical protein
MLLEKVVLLIPLFVSGVWAHNMCLAGFEWVCVDSGFSNMSQGDVAAQFSGAFFYRAMIPWNKTLVSLVPHWMRPVVVLVSQLVTRTLPIVPDDCCLLPAVYEYPPLNASQHYVPPNRDHSGDLECDCNTVMYKCEVRIP